MVEIFQSFPSPSPHTFTEAKHCKTQAFIPNLLPPEDLLRSLSLKHKQPDLPKIPGVWKSEPLTFHLPVWSYSRLQILLFVCLGSSSLGTASLQRGHFPKLSLLSQSVSRCSVRLAISSICNTPTKVCAEQIGMGLKKNNQFSLTFCKDNGKIQFQSIHFFQKHYPNHTGVFRIHLPEC